MKRRRISSEERSSATFKQQAQLNRRIDTVPSSVDPKDFFEAYVAKRRPCIITGLPRGFGGITEDTLLDKAGDAIVQVEKRSKVDEQFGQNRTEARQAEMHLKQLVESLRGPEKELYYLSTQTDESADEKQTNIFLPPCRQLLDSGIIPSSLDLAGSLVLQSCNIWLGAASESCSGLHHDFHDNFYVLLKGRKVFELYPADTDIPTYGTIETVHSNGLVSYLTCPTRSDGVPLEILANGDEDSDSDTTEEVMIGAGFDYNSSDSDNYDESTEQNPDDYEALVLAEKSEAIRPNQFARSQVVSADPLTASLESGQCLYLPASWFHSVTSFVDPSEKRGVHMAFNYWYHPPDAANFGRPYQDCYWPDTLLKDHSLVL